MAIGNTTLVAVAVWPLGIVVLGPSGLAATAATAATAVAAARQQQQQSAAEGRRK